MCVCLFMCVGGGGGGYFVISGILSVKITGFILLYPRDGVRVFLRYNNNIIVIKFYFL